MQNTKGEFLIRGGLHAYLFSFIITPSHAINITSKQYTRFTQLFDKLPSHTLYFLSSKC